MSALTGCGSLSAQRAADTSDYQLCRIVAKPLWTEDAKINAQREIRARNLNCAAYAGAIAQQDAAAMGMIGAGVQMMAPPVVTAPAPACTPNYACMTDCQRAGGMPGFCNARCGCPGL